MLHLPLISIFPWDILFLDCAFQLHPQLKQPFLRLLSSLLVISQSVCKKILTTIRLVPALIAFAGIGRSKDIQKHLHSGKLNPDHRVTNSSSTEMDSVQLLLQLIYYLTPSKECWITYEVMFLKFFTPWKRYPFFHNQDKSLLGFISRSWLQGSAKSWR